MVPNPFQLSGGIFATVTSVEKLLLCIFFIISVTCNADTNSPWHTLNPMAPDSLLSLTINIHSDISCSHDLLGKLPDFLYGLWSHLLESESAAHWIGKIERLLRQQSIS